MKKILYVYRTARKKNLENVAMGLEPDHILYGLNFFKKKGYQASLSDIAYGKLRILSIIYSPIEQLFRKRVGAGFMIVQAILLLPKLRKTDLIITTTDSCGLPVLFLKKIKLIRAPILYISIGWINELITKESSGISKFALSLLESAEKIICLSEVEVKSFKKANPKITEKLKLIPFGIDWNYFKTKKRAGEFILSVGRDKSRDYAFLAKVAKKFPKEKFVIIASPDNVNGIIFPDNVQIFFDRPYSEVREYIERAKIIFIPMKEMNRVSGHTAFLEAVASGKNVVITSVRGLNPTFPELFTKDSPVLSYSPGNLVEAVLALKRSLLSVTKKYKLTKTYDSRNFAKQLIGLIDEKEF